MLLKMHKYHESDTNLMLYSGKQEDHLECNIRHICKQLQKEIDLELNLLVNLQHVMQELIFNSHMNLERVKGAKGRSYYELYRFLTCTCFSLSFFSTYVCSNCKTLALFVHLGQCRTETLSVYLLRKNRYIFTSSHIFLSLFSFSGRPTTLYELMGKTDFG